MLIVLVQGPRSAILEEVEVEERRCKTQERASDVMTIGQAGIPNLKLLRNAYIGAGFDATRASIINVESSTRS